MYQFTFFPLTTKLVYNEAGEDEKLIVVNKNDKYDFIILL